MWPAASVNRCTALRALVEEEAGGVGDAGTAGALELSECTTVASEEKLDSSALEVAGKVLSEAENNTAVGSVWYWFWYANEANEE